MKILVPVKRVVDYEAKIKVKADGSGIETDGIKWIVNPFDEIAVEEAIKLKEAGAAEEVIVLGIGTGDVVTQMRYGMAMGADRGIHVSYDGEIDSDLASRVIVEVFKKDDYGLILMGKQAIDSDAGQTPQLTAARLGLQQASFASSVKVEGDKATVAREVDGGIETVAISLPAVISADLRLNEPRYAPLPGIMKAKKKPLEELTLEDLGVEAGVKIQTVKMSPPEARAAGRKVESVEELIEALQTEARVL